MDSAQSILLSALTGFISGLLLSIPVGPVNLTILNEGARRGFMWAALIGMGATTMEVLYCFIAFTGFASFFTGGWVKFGMQIFSVVFMLVLGVKFLLAKSVTGRAPIGVAAAGIEKKLDERLRPHSAFMIGLVRVMANVGVLIFWIILAANFISRGWVNPDWVGKVACVGGVGLGTGLWFLCLSWLVSLGHGRFTPKALLRMEHFSGLTLVAIGVVHGILVARDMAAGK